MVGSDQKKFGFGEDVRHKGVGCLNTALELCRAVDHGVYFSTQFGLSWVGGTHQVGKADVTDDEQINVAVG